MKLNSFKFYCLQRKLQQKQELLWVPVKDSLEKKLRKLLAKGIIRSNAFILCHIYQAVTLYLYHNGEVALLVIRLSDSLFKGWLPIYSLFRYPD